MSICCSYNNFLSSLCSMSNWNMIISLSSLHFFLMKTRFHNTYNPPALCHILGNPPYSIRRTEKKKTNCAHDNKKIKTFFPQSNLNIREWERKKKKEKRQASHTNYFFLSSLFVYGSHVFTVKAQLDEFCLFLYYYFLFVSNGTSKRCQTKL